MSERSTSELRPAPGADTQNGMEGVRYHHFASLKTRCYKNKEIYLKYNFIYLR